MGKFLAALSALRYGSSLTDPAVWKNRQLAMNALLGLLGAIAPFINVEMTDEQRVAIAGGVAVLGGLLNAYLTAATSEKVGLRASAPAAGEPRADEGGGGGSGGAAGA